MKLGRLNHVGVATPSIEQSVAMYRDLLGATQIGDEACRRIRHGPRVGIVHGQLQIRAAVKLGVGALRLRVSKGDRERLLR